MSGLSIKYSAAGNHKTLFLSATYKWPSSLKQTPLGISNLTVGANCSTVSAISSMSLSVACQTLSFLVPIQTVVLFLATAMCLASGTTANTLIENPAGKLIFGKMFFLTFAANLVS